MKVAEAGLQEPGPPAVAVHVGKLHEKSDQHVVQEDQAALTVVVDGDADRFQRRYRQAASFWMWR